MQIYISKDFSSALSSISKDKLENFNKKTNVLKSMNKTDIINLNDVIELAKTESMVVYAYHIQASTYVLFAFKDKNSLILLDEIELINKNEIKSLVYPVSLKAQDTDEQSKEVKD